MSESLRMVVIVPSFNNGSHVSKNLLSILMQDRLPDQLIYIDDASTDDTFTKANEILKDVPFATVQRNKKNLGAMENYFNTIHKLDDKDIVITVDGDDWLAHEQVFSRIEHAYKNMDIWLTYSQYVKYPTFQIGGSAPLEEARRIRQLPWQTSQLRTFFAGLFKKIKKEDLQFDGKFVPAACDVAMMFPMIEMASNNFHFIDDIQYIYNFSNPLGDGVVRPDIQKEVLHYCRNLPAYESLPSLTSV